MKAILKGALAALSLIVADPVSAFALMPSRGVEPAQLNKYVEQAYYTNRGYYGGRGYRNRGYGNRGHHYGWGRGHGYGRGWR
jgi:hypothetical protein